LRVLVVDDEKGLRDMMSYALKRMKLEVETAENGEKGIAMALAGAYDVVVCDVMMPGLDGVAVLEILKRERPGLEIILVTGIPDEETAARAVKLGAFDYLAKPYNLLLLFELLEKAGARKRGGA
jgi:DNA-binding NtrC family response regulator